MLSRIDWSKGRSRTVLFCSEPAVICLGHEGNIEISVLRIKYSDLPALRSAIKGVSNDLTVAGETNKQICGHV
jgi:hypothetical protein